MSYFSNVTSVLAFLRSEISAQDISTNPVVPHPHNTSRTIPERLPATIIKELSRLEPSRALATTAGEWLSIAAVIALCTSFWHPVLYVIAVMFIGARQHALIIMGHDASHYRYLPKRWQNELLANLFLMWPVFAWWKPSASFTRPITNTQTCHKMGIGTSGTRTTLRGNLRLTGCFPRRERAWCCCSYAVPSSLPAHSGSSGAWLVRRSYRHRIGWSRRDCVLHVRRRSTHNF